MRARCPSRPARVALAGLASLCVLAASGGARADDPGAQADRLRGANAGLASTSHDVLLQLYSLESRIRRAEERIDALEAESARLAREQEEAERQLAIARDNLKTASNQLGQRLRELYFEGDVDPLAVILGAESLDEALSALDGLGRLADQDKQIIEQVTQARAALRAAASRLAARRAEVQAAEVDAKATHAYLVRTQARQAAYLAGLRRQQQLNREQIARLVAQAAESEQRSEELASPGGGAPPAPPQQSGHTLTVSATGYCLKGTTATGIPVDWGIVAVDPALIPLGTRMFVPGYGEGIAADTGSAVRGAMIDVWFPTCSQALAWGRRTVTLTLH